MKFLVLAAALFLTSCMTGSFDQSTLPQTGATGKVNRTMISGEPKAGLKEISYKRHFTRSVQGRQDAVRVMLFVDPYLKLNAQVQSEADGREKGYTPAQIDEEYQKLYANNVRAWTQTKTCFDYELNSNTKEAGNSDNWNVELKSIASGAIYPVQLKFAKEHLSGKGFSWFQFTGVMCTQTRVEPSEGLILTMTPKHRPDKVITLKWE